MKKSIRLMLALVAALSLFAAACGSDSVTDDVVDAVDDAADSAADAVEDAADAVEDAADDAAVLSRDQRQRRHTVGSRLVLVRRGPALGGAYLTKLTDLCQTRSRVPIAE